MKEPETISPERQYNTKLGLILFVIYLLMYLGFVLGNAFKADVMEARVLLGLNLAVVYGFALIKMAFILSLIYGVMCRTEPIAEVQSAASAESQDGSTEGGSSDQEGRESKEGEA